LILQCGAAAALESESFPQRIRRVDPGMSQEVAMAIIGEPEAVVSKYTDQFGRVVEVWRYIPATGGHLIAQDTITVAQDVVPAQVSLPRSPGAGADPHTRIKREADFWAGVQNASTQNPADPLYKPQLRKLPQPVSAAPAPASTLQVYFVTFVDGAVESVRLGETL